MKFFTAASSEQVSFNMLHKKCSTRVKQQLICPTDSEIVERTDTLKGYEYARGQYVTFRVAGTDAAFAAAAMVSANGTIVRILRIGLTG